MTESISYRSAILQSMHQILSNDPRAFVYGLGADEPNGIFGTTHGLSEKFGQDRCWNTPISEDSNMGFALGASLAGLYPVQIHIRADFLLLTMNQLVNSISKYRYMYGGQLSCPMLIRAVIGRSWGQGAQHSQSLHATLSHFPGLSVIMPSHSSRVLTSYRQLAQRRKDIVISFEHRSLYDLDFHARPPIDDPFQSEILCTGEHLTIASMSFPAIQSWHVAQSLQSLGASIEVIDLHSPSHLEIQKLIKSINKTKRLLIVDPGWSRYGLSAEISRRLLHEGIQLNAFHEMAWADSPCPTSHALEEVFYPQTLGIAKKCLEILQLDPKESQKVLPLEKKKFRGPF